MNGPPIVGNRRHACAVFMTTHASSHSLRQEAEIISVWSIEDVASGNLVTGADLGSESRLRRQSPNSGTRTRVTKRESSASTRFIPGSFFRMPWREVDHTGLMWLAVS
ncbi:uncharacterized protein CPUR_04519 [Claviceps purpurea 20.1]|uniref:Uncharacterized protein n=1 Tax=Claviceps purpurea (strain 20.1) TaxID=1111077 RepID=M1W6S3_CLAP2|nr:uncharacterized protein CPUR_04519 [Claviceps purpurea 20.1]